MKKILMIALLVAVVSAFAKPKGGAANSRSVFGKNKNAMKFIAEKSYVVSRDAKTIKGKVIVTWRKNGVDTVVTNSIRSLIGVKQNSSLHNEVAALKTERDTLKAEKAAIKAERDAAKEEARLAKEELKAEKKKNKNK